MSENKKRAKKRVKGDTEKRLERIVDLFSLAALFYVTLGVLFNVISLILLKTADMLIPFKLLIISGFTMLGSISISSIYYHIIEKGLREPRLLCVKVISAGASVITMTFGISLAMSLQAWLNLDFSLNAPTLLALVSGILAAIIGLVSALRRMNKG